jgi:GT2 family glycosyltransferase
MMSAVKTSLIMPCYFADESFVDMTRVCLHSLRFGMPDEVIVVDDGSPIEPKYNAFPVYGRTIRRKKNGGYAAAVNTGLQAATGDIIIIANNDIEFVPGWLEAITEPLQNGYDIGSIRTHGRTDTDAYTTKDKVTEGDEFGSLWAMRRETYGKLGPLDTRFGKGYFEDTDYRRRALDAGLRIAKNHRAVVEHVGSATFGAVDPDRELFERAMEVFRQKWGEKHDEDGDPSHPRTWTRRLESLRQAGRWLRRSRGGVDKEVNQPPDGTGL